LFSPSFKTRNLAGAGNYGTRRKTVLLYVASNARQEILFLEVVFSQPAWRKYHMPDDFWRIAALSI
jgi:hypothetical protein